MDGKIMDIITIKEEIETKVKVLEIGRGLLLKRADAKAHAIANYDKALAIKILQLKSAEEVEIDGATMKVKGLPGNLLEKVAKGLCGDERYEMEKAEGEYKAATSGMDSLRAELNAYQSLNRHLD